MSYRKFKADYLFTGKDFLDDNYVLITDEQGVVIDIKNVIDAGDDVEIFKGILSPGFINCHCHLELSHLKNVVEQGTGLVDFLIRVITNRNAVKENIEAAIIDADKEMFENGIVAVGDICNSTDSIQTKKSSKIYYQNFIEVLGFTEENAATRFQHFINIYNEFLNAGLTNTSIVPHAPYTISSSMFKLINDFSKGKIVSIHNQETLAEDELYKTKAGEFLKLYQHLNINVDFFKPFNKSSLQSYFPLLNEAKNLLLVHDTFTTQEDIEFANHQSKISNQQLFWCLCANANLYIENKLPPIELLQKNNCDIVLGTDSYSSNHSLNILDEMKTLHLNFPSIELKDLLQWATFNGAKALNIDNKFGSFEKNKQPGVLLISHLSNKNITNNSTIERII